MSDQFVNFGALDYCDGRRVPVSFCAATRDDFLETWPSTPVENGTVKYRTWCRMCTSKERKHLKHVASNGPAPPSAASTCSAPQRQAAAVPAYVASLQCGNAEEAQC